MQLRDAVEMLRASRLDALGPTTWADLGCGDGTFARALAELVAPGSVIHAMDVDRVALRSLPARHGQARIETHVGDFTKPPWPFAHLDGVLMANSLHYVHHREQASFITDCRARMVPPHRFLLVEYDSDVPNPYVPYPVSLQRVRQLFDVDVAGASLTLLGRRPSRYQRAALYAVLITIGASSRTARDA